MKQLVFTLLFLLTPFMAVANEATWHVLGTNDSYTRKVYYNIDKIEHEGIDCMVITTHFKKGGYYSYGGGLDCDWGASGGSEEPTIHNGADVLINIKDMNK